MKLTSPVFRDGEELPQKYTCDGESISPPIEWHGEPAETKSFVLIYDDPDASGGVWDHWVLYNLPSTTHSIPEDTKTLPEETKLGLNSWSNTGYGPPSSPSGEHRYIFHLYALDTALELPDKSTTKQIYKAIKGHVLEETTLTGRYTRST